MGKLSKILLGTIVCVSVNGQDDPTFQVISCNADDSSPALTFKIQQDYFENNINDENDDFILADGFYSRTVEQDELTLAFDDADDVITLSYTQATISNGFSLNDTTNISFAEDSIEFQCRYARSINASSQITFIPTEPVVGTGTLNYIITVTGENTDGSLALGGNTDVRITPNHGFDQIVPRIESCNISHGEHELYAMHSFSNNELCVDHSRLRVVQTEFGQNLGFSMRTFRFIISGSQATEEQQQTISCNLHLEPVANVSSTQPDDCSCHSEEACAPDPTDPATYNLPDGYMYSEQSWGRFFWRRGGGADWETAKNTCEQEGAVLPVPRDSGQSNFLFFNACGAAFSTEPNTIGCYGAIWLGINDEETEGTFVDNDGVPITWSNWHSESTERCDTNNHTYGNDCETLDAAFIYGRHWGGATTTWGKAQTTEQTAGFMCIKFLDD